MDLSKIIIVPKLTHYEWDMQRLNLTHKEIIQKYRRDGIDVDRIMESHCRQKDSLDELKQYFNEKQFISRDNLAKEISKDAELIISSGGDNHFQYVAHFVNNKPIIGLNSDPHTSTGVLTYYTTKNFEKSREKWKNKELSIFDENILKRIKKDEINIEEWTLLEGILNGKKIQPTMTEYVIGEKEAHRDMTRYILDFDRKKEEQKSSGLIISTGAGSTGYYNSVYKFKHKRRDVFPKTEKIAKFITIMPYEELRGNYSILEGVLREGDEMIIHSLSKHEGKIYCDILEDYNFNGGAKFIVRISQKSLKVLGK